MFVFFVLVVLDFINIFVSLFPDICLFQIFVIFSHAVLRSKADFNAVQYTP